MHFLAEDHSPTGTPWVSGIWIPKFEPGLGDCSDPHRDIGEERRGREEGKEEPGGGQGLTMFNEGGKRTLRMLAKAQLPLQGSAKLEN